MKKWEPEVYALDLFIKNENVEEFSAVVDEIHDLRGKELPIPLELINRFFSLIIGKYHVDAMKFDKAQEEAKPYLDKVKAQYSADPSYWFSGEKVVKLPTFNKPDPLFDTEYKSKYSIEQMITSVLMEFLSLSIRPERKNVAVSFFFDAINKYCNSSFDKKHLKSFGEYKRLSYAGFLAVLFKYDFIYNKKPNAATYYGIARNTVVTSHKKPVKKKKSQRKR